MNESREEEEKLMLLVISSNDRVVQTSIEIDMYGLLIGSIALWLLARIWLSLTCSTEMTPDDDDYQLRACAHWRRFVLLLFVVAVVFFFFLLVKRSLSPPQRANDDEKEDEEAKNESDISLYTSTHTHNDFYRHWLTFFLWSLSMKNSDFDVNDCWDDRQSNLIDRFGQISLDW